MAYFLRSRPITRSTWMCTLAIPLVCSTSNRSSCDFLFVNAGIVNFACLSPTLSEIVKPLSAMTISPGTKNSKKSQFSVRYLSEVRPPQASDKEMLPWGVIPIRTLTILWCFYDENVWALASKLDGRSINTSKQSIVNRYIIALTVLFEYLNIIDTFSPVSKNSCSSLKYIIELESNDLLPFLWRRLFNMASNIEI